MSPNRPAHMARPLAALLVALAFAAPAVASGPPVTLVETRPVESTLGNPELPEAHTVWLDLIGGAKRRLDIEQFYLSHWPGHRTGPVLDAIGAAAKRGVKVRLILDARMSATYPLPADSLARVPGIEVRRIDFRRLGGGVQHAKFFLVDGERAFVGSQNLDWRALEHIHELGVRIDDARVTGVFQQVFEMDWAACDTTAAGRDTLAALRAWFDRAALPTLPIAIAQGPGDTVKVWPSYSPKGFIPEPALWDLDAMVRLIDGARTEVVGQALGYGIGGRGQRDSTLDQAFRRAAARGVKVRLVISDWETGGITDLQALAALPNVAIRLSTVPEWSGGYIPFARVQHCKYLVADAARAWVGTSNWEPDYFFSSRNLGVTLANARLAGQAQKVFETSWAAPGAKPVVPGATYPRKVRGEQSPDGRPVYGK